MDRFLGKAGRRSVIAALRQQASLDCCEPAISEIAKYAKVETFAEDAQLIIQNSDDNRLAFILSGRVAVLVNGHKVAERISGQHVGEMSVIDPSARRSGSIVACEKTSVAWISEPHFSSVAAQHPNLWRGLALELANRLRQRAQFIRDRNPKPKIFIGSSSESIRIAKQVRRAFQADPVEVNLWSEGVFGASDVTIESLEKLLPSTDFAVLLLTADDQIKIRKQNKVSPRDNVIFELGLFIGAIGRPRTFMLVDVDEKNLRLPPDLHGVTYIPISTTDKKKTKSQILSAISQIRDRITEFGPR